MLQGSKGREEQVLQQLPDKEVALAGSEKLRKQLTNQVTLLRKDLSAAKCQAEEVRWCRQPVRCACVRGVGAVMQFHSECCQLSPLYSRSGGAGNSYLHALRASSHGTAAASQCMLACPGYHTFVMLSPLSAVMQISYGHDFVSSRQVDPGDTSSSGLQVLKRHSAQTRELRQRLAHSQTEIKDLQLSSAALKHSCTQAQQVSSSSSNAQEHLCHAGLYSSLPCTHLAPLRGCSHEAALQ